MTPFSRLLELPWESITPEKAMAAELSWLSVRNGDGNYFYDLVNPVVDK